MHVTCQIDITVFCARALGASAASPRFSRPTQARRSKMLELSIGWRRDPWNRT